MGTASKESAGVQFQMENTNAKDKYTWIILAKYLKNVKQSLMEASTSNGAVRVI